MPLTFPCDLPGLKFLIHYTKITYHKILNHPGKMMEWKNIRQDNIKISPLNTIIITIVSLFLYYRRSLINLINSNVKNCNSKYLVNEKSSGGWFWVYGNDTCIEHT
jgi:hypothetical protein